MGVTRAQIEAAVKKATGNPDVGTVAVVIPAIVDELDKLINGEPAKEERVIKAKETPETK
jgi:hypothetical protein